MLLHAKPFDKLHQPLGGILDFCLLQYIGHDYNVLNAAKIDIIFETSKRFCYFLCQQVKERLLSYHCSIHETLI